MKQSGLRRASYYLTFGLLAISFRPASGQQPPTATAPAAPANTANLPQPKNWTAVEDHQNMMEQLGIKALRPGPSGNEKAISPCKSSHFTLYSG